ARHAGAPPRRRPRQGAAGPRAPARARADGAARRAARAAGAGAYRRAPSPGRRHAGSAQDRDRGGARERPGAARLTSTGPGSLAAGLPPRRSPVLRKCDGATLASMLRARTFGPALVLALAWLSAAPARA